MTLLDQEQFLAELGKLFMKGRGGGKKSVSITLKHYDGHTKPYPRTDPTGVAYVGDDKCLFRARLGNKKISTVVSCLHRFFSRVAMMQVNAKEVNKFQLAYAAVLKANMDNLKKRERKQPGTAASGGAGKAKTARVATSAKTH